MIDLHSHILPGLDDGVRTLEESVELARLAAESGIETIAATPHVREDYPTTATAMEGALEEVRARIDQAGIPVRVLPGGEVALEQLDRLPLEDLRRFGLGGNSSYLLVETPYHALPLDFEDRLFRLRAAGITPVLAHPERSVAIRDDPGLIARVVESGALVQVIAASLDGRDGKRVRARALGLVTAGLAHCVASDAHAPGVRRGGLETVAGAVGDAALARWLTLDVPAAILAGAPLPGRPETPKRRGFRLRR